MSVSKACKNALRVELLSLLLVVVLLVVLLPPNAVIRF
jgi:hypothetical protein